MLNLLTVFVCVVPCCYAWAADTKMYLSETCREIKSMGKNTCAYCNDDGVPLCNYTAYWDSCVDKATPNPCNANEILAIDSRDYLINYDDTCQRVCPNQYCYSNTNTYDDQCCSCPSGYRPSLTPPTCFENRGPGIAITCVGCENPDEVLVGDDQKGWECLPKTSTTTTTAKPTETSTCDRTCDKDTWCPAHWVLKTNANGKQTKLCHCNSGSCKDKDATCPTACLVENPVIRKTCSALRCSKVKDKDKCFPNQKGLDLIKSEERLCTTFYNVCDGVKTIGFGHNCNAHEDCDNLKLPLSLCEAERLFVCDVTELMQRVKRLPNYSLLSLNQFSALVSLAFQFPKAFKRDGTIWNHMNTSAPNFDYMVICNDILTATTDHQHRREKEAELCLEEPVTAMRC